VLARPASGAQPHRAARRVERAGERSEKRRPVADLDVSEKPRSAEGIRDRDEVRCGQSRALEEPGVVPFAIVSQGRVVGSTRFLRMEHWSRLNDRPPDVPHVADIGWTWLAASAQRTGVNTEAKFLMLRHAFETWRVFRVAIKVDVPNERSRRAVESLGAKLDGIRRAERLGEDGTVLDCAWYSIVQDEWPSVKETLESRLR